MLPEEKLDEVGSRLECLLDVWNRKPGFKV
jgi:hypothetical protein